MDAIKHIIENAIEQTKEFNDPIAQMVTAELYIIRACLSDPNGHRELWGILEGFAKKSIERLDCEIAEQKAIQN